MHRNTWLTAILILLVFTSNLTAPAQRFTETKKNYYEANKPVSTQEQLPLRGYLLDPAKKSQFAAFHRETIVPWLGDWGVSRCDVWTVELNDLFLLVISQAPNNPPWFRIPGLDKFILRDELPVTERKDLRVDIIANLTAPARRFTEPGRSYNKSNKFMPDIASTAPKPVSTEQQAPLRIYLLNPAKRSEFAAFHRETIVPWLVDWGVSKYDVWTVELNDLFLLVISQAPNDPPWFRIPGLDKFILRDELPTIARQDLRLLPH